jgi:hypothetical protein
MPFDQRQKDFHPRNALDTVMPLPFHELPGAPTHPLVAQQTAGNCLSIIRQPFIDWTHQPTTQRAPRPHMGLDLNPWLYVLSLLP